MYKCRVILVIVPTNPIDTPSHRTCLHVTSQTRHHRYPSNTRFIHIHALTHVKKKKSKHRTHAPPSVSRQGQTLCFPTEAMPARAVTITALRTITAKSPNIALCAYASRRRWQFDSQQPGKSVPVELHRFLHITTLVPSRMTQQTRRPMLDSSTALSIQMTGH